MRRLIPLLPPVIGASLCIVLFVHTAVAEQNKEWEVKAQFLHRFCTLIDWPDKAFKKDDAPFVIGVHGDKNPFGDTLEEVFRRKKIHGRRVELRIGVELKDLDECHAVWIAEEDEKALKKIREVLAEKPVLQVGDGDDFAADGGHIELTLTHERKIRFRMHKDALEKSGLEADSRVLRLADKVYED